MYFFRNIFVTISLFSLISSAFSNEKSLLYVKNVQRNGYTCEYGDIAASFEDVKNERVCLSACAARRCARVFYYPDSEICLGCFSLYISVSLPVSVGSVHYEASLRCPCLFGKFNTSCYKVTDSKMTWTAAKNYCESISGSLATIENSDENSYVTQWLQSTGVGWTDLSVFIGATDSDEEGTWLNVNGEEQIFKNWAFLQPDNGPLGLGNEDCVAVDMLFAVWNDLPCSENHRAVCEIKQI